MDWISVSDQLPPDRCLVRVYVPALRETDEAEWGDPAHTGALPPPGTRNGHYSRGSGRWRIADSPSAWEVTYWQPLPAPPARSQA